MTIQWHTVEPEHLEGRGWSEGIQPFTRLPDRAERIATAEVWQRSRTSTGLCVWFETDARAIHARWSLRDALHVEPATTLLAHSGLDLYGVLPDAPSPRLRWVAAIAPDAQTTAGKPFIETLIPETRAYCVYLPAYNPVTALSLGVPDDATFAFLPPRIDKPIAYYGTSIVHGRHTSRPGMPHAAQLGRRLERAVLNLGFAGVAKMEHPLAELFAELDPCLWLIDPVPNMTPGMIDQRAVPFIQTLRAARPDVPIVMIADRVHAHAPFVRGLEQNHAAKRAAWTRAFEQLRASGVNDLHYIPHDDLLGHDGDATQDGSHPNDLGFFRYTEAIAPTVDRILTQHPAET